MPKDGTFEIYSKGGILQWPGGLVGSHLNEAAEEKLCTVMVIYLKDIFVDIFHNVLLLYNINIVKAWNGHEMALPGMAYIQIVFWLEHNVVFRRYRAGLCSQNALTSCL